MSLLAAITRPTLLISERRCRANIQAMADKAKRNQLRFRPHFKTHQHAVVGSWFRDAGVNAITVSSVSMAEDCVRDGWKDITIAFPFNIREIEAVNRLAAKVNINILIADQNILPTLVAQLDKTLGVFIKIDTGYGRSGFHPEHEEKLIRTIVDDLAIGGLKFKGFLSHPGHSYAAQHKDDIVRIHKAAMRWMLQLKSAYHPQYPQLELSLGDTPCCSIMEDFRGITEFRPGNFVYYDLVQAALGACTPENIGVVMACPVVVGAKESAKKLLIHGGAVHFSKDHLIDPITASPFYGKVVSWQEDKNDWGGIRDGMQLVKLSQEHGTVNGDSSQLQTYKAGDLIFILPIHSCLNANLMRLENTLIV